MDQGNPDSRPTLSGALMSAWFSEKEVQRDDLMRAKEEDAWSLGNNVLYQLCRDYPSHSDRQIVVAKVWLIGKAYSVPIERRRKNLDVESNESYYEDIIAPALMTSRIDRMLQSLDHLEDTNSEATTRILATHKHLVDTLKEASGLNKRSFCSKYLHFHCPGLFYIYDSRARKGLGKLMKSPKKRWPIPPSVDREYAGFFYRALEATTRLEVCFGIKLDPRQLDRLLIRILS